MKVPTRFLRPFPAGLVTLVALASCSTFTFRNQDVYLRHLPEEDALEIVLVYEGVYASKSDEKSTADGARAVRAIERGRRHFILLDWPLEFDLPALEAESEGAEDELARKAVDFSRGIVVLESRILRSDRDGALCALQHVGVPAVSQGIGLLNEAINRWILEEEKGEGGLAAELEWADARTVELWSQQAHAGRAWLALSAGAVEVRVPLSTRGAARTFVDLLDLAGEDSNLKRIFGPLSEIEVADETVVLRFRPDERGWIHFPFEWEERVFQPGLQQRLERERDTLPTGDLAREVERLLEGE